MEHPAERAADRGRWPAVGRFLVAYADRVWLFIISILVLIALAVGLTTLKKVGDQARASCNRSRVVIPIQVDALTSGLAQGNGEKFGIPGHYVTKGDVARYARERPESC